MTAGVSLVIVWTIFWSSSGHCSVMVLLDISSSRVGELACGYEPYCISIELVVGLVLVRIRDGCVYGPLAGVEGWVSAYSLHSYSYRVGAL